MTRKKLIAFALEFFKAGMEAQEVGMPNFDQLIKTEFYKGKIDEILALPIDVPGDEERIKEQSEYLTDKEERAFYAGQKWMKNEILKRNRP